MESALALLNDMEPAKQEAFLKQAFSKVNSSVLGKVPQMIKAGTSPRPSIFANANKKCVVCKKTAYPKESIELRDGLRVHTGLCLKCQRCHSKLNLKSYVSKRDKVFCFPCSKRPDEAATTVRGADCKDLSQNTVDQCLPDAEYDTGRGLISQKTVVQSKPGEESPELPTTPPKYGSHVFQGGKKVVIENNIIPEEILSSAVDVNFAGNTLLGRTKRIMQMTDAQKRQFVKIFDILTENPNIKTVVISSCGLDNWCAEIIAKFIIASKSLIFINLDNNYISSAGVQAIAQALQQNNSIRALTIQGQWKYTCSHEACDAMLKAFEFNNSITQFGFTFLLQERQIVQNQWISANNDAIRKLRWELTKKVIELDHVLKTKYF